MTFFVLTILVYSVVQLMLFEIGLFGLASFILLFYFYFYYVLRVRLYNNYNDDDNSMLVLSDAVNKYLYRFLTKCDNTGSLCSD